MKFFPNIYIACHFSFNSRDQGSDVGSETCRSKQNCVSDVDILGRSRANADESVTADEFEFDRDIGILISLRKFFKIR